MGDSVTEQYDALQFPFRTAKMQLARLVLLSDIPEAMELRFEIELDEDNILQNVDDLIADARELYD